MATQEGDTPLLNAAEPSLLRVAFRVPPFWAEKPTVWFSQLEGFFRLHSITCDETKYSYVITSLESRYAAEVEDILVAPPANDKYTKLKSELIRRLSASQEKKLRQLLEHEEMGDREPSRFLRHLRTLAGSTVTDDFLRSLWLGRLPSHVQSVVAAQTNLNLDVIAELADRVNEFAPRTHVSATSETSELQSIVQELAEVRKQLAAFSVDNTRRGNYNKHRSRSNSKTRDATSHTTRDMCWYHRRFGVRARKCNLPCSYQSENEQGSR